MSALPPNAFSPQALSLDALRAAGEPELFTRKVSDWKAKLVNWFEDLSGRKLYSDQTEMFLIEMCAYAFALHGENAHSAILQNLLVFAEGEHLALGALNNSIEQLLASHAVTKMRFSVPAATNKAITIPAKTLVSGGEIYFETDTTATIFPGESAVEVLATAVDAGNSGNGFLPGQISVRLASLAENLVGENVFTSSGGAATESDSALRRVAVDGPEAFDRNGGWGSYGLAVRRVSPAIKEVAVDRPQPGHIHLIITGEDDEPVGQALLNQVRASILGDDKRPQGDFLSDVRSGAPHNIDGTLTLRVDPAFDVAEVVAQADLRVDAAITKMRRIASAGSDRTRFAPDTGRLGAQISSSAITTAVMSVSGVIDAVLPDVAYTDLPFDEYPRRGNLVINTVSGADV